MPVIGRQGHSAEQRVLALAAVLLGLTALAPAAAVAAAHPHEGELLMPHEVWRAWSFEPGVILALGLTAWGYARGLRVLWARGAGRGGVERWEAAAFALGWVVLALSLMSPIHAMGEVLFSAHMVQHELLMAVAAPLLVLGRPMLPLLWALPTRLRHGLGRLATVPSMRRTWWFLVTPLVATLIHGIAIWAWHAPGLFQATLDSEFVHSLQHISFLGSGVLFWWALLHGHGERRGYGVAVLAVFITAAHTGALGALLAFAQTDFYPQYARSTPAWGLTPLDDQQLAGLVMWVPASVIYLLAALGLFWGWLRESERRVAIRAAGFIAVIALGVNGCDRESADSAARQLTGADPARGRAAVAAYGCGTCHSVRGVPGAVALVGPPLQGLGERAYIAGVLPNTPDNLARWIMDPQGVDPRTAMPNLGVTAADARAIASYLYTLR
ncbi:MAG TPA: cytochrome c oxidase assembly protein [Gemmatimonadales bacterium]|nr:cytochrome c oxidase assembly protein [Gemmatimonadales bacterium]